MTLPQKVNFGPETSEIEPKVGTWTCPAGPKKLQVRAKPSRKTPLLFGKTTKSVFWRCLVDNTDISANPRARNPPKSIGNL